MWRRGERDGETKREGRDERWARIYYKGGATGRAAVDSVTRLPVRRDREGVATTTNRELHDARRLCDQEQDEVAFNAGTYPSKGKATHARPRAAEPCRGEGGWARCPGAPAPRASRARCVFLRVLSLHRCHLMSRSHS